MSIEEDDNDKEIYCLKRGELYLYLDGTLALPTEINIAAFPYSEGFKASIDLNLDLVKKPKEWLYIPFKN